MSKIEKHESELPSYMVLIRDHGIYEFGIGSPKKDEQVSEAIGLGG